MDWLQGVLLVALFKPLSDTTDRRCIQMLLALSHTTCLATEWRTQPAVAAALPADSPTPMAARRACGALGYLRARPALPARSGPKAEHRAVSRHAPRPAMGASAGQAASAYSTCSPTPAAFSVAAMAGGATQVVNLDMARAALSRGRDNHRLNQHDLSQVVFLGHDLFKSWGKVAKYGPYDLIIIDPPSFQRGSFDPEQGLPQGPTPPDQSSAQRQACPCWPAATNRRLARTT